jgi:nitroreductase
MNGFLWAFISSFQELSIIESFYILGVARQTQREVYMLEGIRSRRSIRQFKPDDVGDRLINQIIETGTWAPSGLNNQPWRFVIVRDEDLRKEIAQQTRYGHIIRSAPVCIAVFLDNAASYDRVKDIQAIGACIQNMLLALHHLGLGGVWLGEILRNRDKVEKVLQVPEDCELMAVVAVGQPADAKGGGMRKPINEVILHRK